MSNDSEQSIVVGVIRDLTARLEGYEQRAEANRALFQEKVMVIVTELRTDMNRAIIPMQVDHQDHRRTHDVDRAERSSQIESDRTERSNRQLATDQRFGALHDDIRQLRYLLIGIIALMAIAIGILVVRFV